MKKLNTDSITNELANSSFFPSRPVSGREEGTTKPLPQPSATAAVKPAVIQTAPQTTPAPVSQKPIASAEPRAAAAGRRYIRRTFDFYEDQIAYLTKASLEDRLAGKEGSMNAMVREAVDTLIRERRRSEGSS
jgi:hypothetical protein